MLFPGNEPLSSVQESNELLWALGEHKDLPVQWCSCTKALVWEAPHL